MKVERQNNKQKTGPRSILPDVQGNILKSGEGFFHSGFSSFSSLVAFDPTGCTWPEFDKQNSYFSYYVHNLLSLFRVLNTSKIFTYMSIFE